MKTFFVLAQNHYPSIFSISDYTYQINYLSFQFTISYSSNLMLAVYYHFFETDWDGSNYSSGVYFYKLAAGDFIETKKMVLIK